jgi:hypothetical protein
MYDDSAPPVCCNGNEKIVAGQSVLGVLPEQLSPPVKLVFVR